MRTSSIRFAVTASALSSAAPEMIAVPCWSSWKTGMFISAFRRRSISKHSGERVLAADLLHGGRILLPRPEPAAWPKPKVRRGKLKAMIVVPEGTAYRLITQPDHAHLAAEILALWRRDGLPAHPRRENLLFAAREHDNGWREADAAPRWDPGTGRPHDFMTLPTADRIEIWERGPCRFATERPYAAQLIARHARHLLGGRRGEEGWDGLLDFLADFERGLSEETGVPEDELAADYRWIELADQISLTACAGRRERVVAGRRPAAVRPLEVGRAAVDQVESVEELEIADFQGAEHLFERIELGQLLAVLVFRELALADAGLARDAGLALTP